MCGDYFDQREEHNDFHYASEAEVDQAGAHAEGANRTDQAWILSDRDVWYANPYYNGPAICHPDDDSHDGEGSYNEPDRDEPEDYEKNCGLDFPF